MHILSVNIPLRNNNYCIRGIIYPGNIIRSYYFELNTLLKVVHCPYTSRIQIMYIWYGRPTANDAYVRPHFYLNRILYTWASKEIIVTNISHNDIISYGIKYARTLSTVSLGLAKWTSDIGFPLRPNIMFPSNVPVPSSGNTEL